MKKRQQLSDDLSYTKHILLSTLHNDCLMLKSTILIYHQPDPISSKSALKIIVENYKK